jgi:hypothetical protein
MDRPTWILNEAEWHANCQAIVSAAQALIDGRAGVIESARSLCRLAYSVRDQKDESFVFFTAVDSESDALPVGKERENWSPEALERQDMLIHEFEKVWHSRAISQAQRLIDRYRISLS